MILYDINGRKLSHTYTLKNQPLNRIYDIEVILAGYSYWQVC